MIALLGFLLDGVELIGTYVLWAGEELVSGLLDAAVLGWNLVLSMLPSFPTVTPIGTPEWLAWLNWFYPVGGFIALFTAIVACWTAYLAARFLLRLLRQ